MKTIEQIKPNLSNNCDTIVASCTSARSGGAIALIRLCGNDAIALTDNFSRLSSKKLLSQTASHTIHHGHIIDPDANDERIDEVMFLLMKGPKTFTGQDTVEICCHDNPFIIERIISTAIKHGARSAQPGEFTKRAYLEEKIDLVQAESINDLIHAQTELGVKKALAQLSGSLSSVMVDLQTQLITLIGLVESSFEFLEEEQQDLKLAAMVNEKLQNIMNTIGATKSAYNQQKQIKEGVRIALLGSVNAGKSTLFNKLVQKERAIVTNIAGTTRDSIESSCVVNGVFWLLIDTAGLRETGDIIEQKGIEQSLQQAHEADVILLVIDGTQILSEQEQETYQYLLTQYSDKIITIVNKNDISTPSNPLASFPQKQTSISISAKNTIGINAVKNAIEQKITTLFSHFNAPYLINKRHHEQLTEMETKLKLIANSYSNNVQYELMAYHLRDLVETISQLTGKNVSEEILDTVFSTFCIGK